MNYNYNNQIRYYPDEVTTDAADSHWDPNNDNIQSIHIRNQNLDPQQTSIKLLAWLLVHEMYHIYFNWQHTPGLPDYASETASACVPL